MSSRAITIVLFGAMVVDVVALQWWARRPGTRVPTLGAVAGVLASRRVGRVAVLGFWAWTGWHFFAR